MYGKFLKFAEIFAAWKDGGEVNIHENGLNCLKWIRINFIAMVQGKI
jgi:hypothetical protein